ncbi:DUF2891 domain-containing protein, partial [bacterium]|nr:DUF2891 domain-containing protein [bacterium]
LDNRDTILAQIRKNLSRSNILAEVAYFQRATEKSYERTYGWAWLLKLAAELHTWSTPIARELEKNLQPLTDLFVTRYLEFLPKLNYPIRVGEHPNTAFGLTFAWDYAVAVNHTVLKMLVEQRALDFYREDIGCPIGWEPGGFDFLSPCLEEADIMRRVLPREKYKQWLTQFLPQLSNPSFTLEPGRVSDRSDGKLVHLDGVNFSRAWCLYGIADVSAEYAHLRRIADSHIRYSLNSVADGNYEGGHWLASFAIYALEAAAAPKK